MEVQMKNPAVVAVLAFVVTAAITFVVMALIDERTERGRMLRKRLPASFSVDTLQRRLPTFWEGWSLRSRENKLKDESLR